MTPAHFEIVSQNETARLAAVRRYDILDTPPDGAFDRITAIAARIFGVPISIVSLVDNDRIWFKSHHGLDVRQIDREPGLCASAILQDKPYLLTDAKLDPRSLANPLVAGEFGLRFYLGVPLETHDKFNLGTLCVIDRQPRTVSAEQIETLRDLARVVMDEMELRLGCAARGRRASTGRRREGRGVAPRRIAREGNRPSGHEQPADGVELPSPAGQRDRVTRGEDAIRDCRRAGCGDRAGPSPHLRGAHRRR